MTQIFITTTNDLKVRSVHQTREEACKMAASVGATRIFVADRDGPDFIRKRSNKLMPSKARELQ